jgi:hypothetical protein
MILTHEQRLELQHLWAVTRDGRWSHRANTAIHKTLAKRGLIETNTTQSGEYTYAVHRLTAAGADAYRALQTNESEDTR